MKRTGIPRVVQRAMKFRPQERTKEDKEVLELWQENNVLNYLLDYCLEPQRPVEIKAYAQEIKERLCCGL